MTLKRVYTAPSMIYDASTKRIVPNPLYDRAFVSELTRLQGQVVSQLRRASRDSLARTPKELLVEVERAFLCILTSTLGEANTHFFHVVSEELEAVAKLPHLERCFAEHSIPPHAIMATAYTVSEGLVQSTLWNYLEMLNTRIEAEMKPEMNQRRSAEERQALHATSNNLRDLRNTCESLRVAYGGMVTTSQLQRPQSTAVDGAISLSVTSAHANVQSADLLSSSYYGLVRWLLAVDVERVALQQGTTTATTPDVWVSDFDLHSGKITLQRRDLSVKWGLIFNQEGNLTGLDNALSNASEAGHQLLLAMQRSDSAAGFAVLELNRRRIREAHMSSEEVAAQRAEILSKLRDGCCAENKTLTVVIAKQPHDVLTTAHEILFDLASQGGEGAVGGRAILVLKRPSPEVPWGLRLKLSPGGEAAYLTDFTDQTRLSEAAKNFLYDNRQQLRIIGINHVDTKALTAKGGINRVMKESLVLSIVLQVVDSKTTAGELTDVEVTEANQVMPEAEPVVFIPEAAEATGELPVVENTEVAPNAADEMTTSVMEAEERPAALDTDLEEPKAQVENMSAILGEAEAEIIEGSDWASTPIAEEQEDTATRIAREEEEHRALLEENFIPQDEPLPVEEESHTATEEVTRSAADEIDAAVHRVLASEGLTPVEIADDNNIERPTKKPRKLRETPKSKKAKEKRKTAAAQPKGKVPTLEVASDDALDSEEATKVAKSVVGEEIDKPLIDLSTSADAALKTVTQKSKTALKTPVNETEVVEPPSVVAATVPKKNAGEPSDGGEGAPAALADIIGAPPLTFENHVVVKNFDGRHMELERSSVADPWDIKVAFQGDDLLMTRLPQVEDANANHPFLKYLQASPTGQVRCAMEGINGVDLSLMSKAARTKALGAIKSATRLSLLLKVMRQ